MPRAPLLRRARRGTHLALLHLGQALLPGLLILQADPHHAVHVVGVSIGRKKTSAALPEEEGRLGRGVAPSLREEASPQPSASIAGII